MHQATLQDCIWYAKDRIMDELDDFQTENNCQHYSQYSEEEKNRIQNWGKLIALSEDSILTLNELQKAGYWNGLEDTMFESCLPPIEVELGLKVEIFQFDYDCIMKMSFPDNNPFFFSHSMLCQFEDQKLFGNCESENGIAKKLRKAGVLTEKDINVSESDEMIIEFKTEKQGHEFIDRLNSHLKEKIIASHSNKSLARIHYLKETENKTMPSTSVKLEFNSPYILGNKKTDFSVEFGTEVNGRSVPCPLMVWKYGRDIPGSKTRYPDREMLTTPKCKGCYAATNMNTRTNLRDKIINLPKQTAETLEAFKKDMIILKALGIERLRFYSWTDFSGPEDLPFILAAADAGIEVHILSKMLTTKKHTKSLMELFNKNNVVISLSFNKDWKHDLDRIENILNEFEPNNVQINYTFNPRADKDENIEELKEKFQVLHLKNKQKRTVGKEFDIPDTQLCGVFDKAGKDVETNGHCGGCNNCNLSYIMHKMKQNKEHSELVTA
jgi:hypothetical protein